MTVHTHCFIGACNAFFTLLLLLLVVSFVCVVVTAVQCPTPENPSNGKAIFTSCSYNSVVSYECKYGYTLVGEPTRRCGADKRWSGVMPQCKGELQSYLLF